MSTSLPSPSSTQSEERSGAREAQYVLSVTDVVGSDGPLVPASSVSPDPVDPAGVGAHMFDRAHCQTDNRWKPNTASFPPSAEKKTAKTCTPRFAALALVDLTGSKVYQQYHDSILLAKSTKTGFELAVVSGWRVGLSSTLPKASQHFRKSALRQRYCNSI